MKNWKNPELVAVDVKATEHKWTGIYRDGGYIGDGEVSGHLSWTNTNEQPSEPSQPEQPQNPAENGNS